MFKKTIIIGFAVLIAIFAFQPVEKAEAKVRVYLGVGGFPGYYGPGYYGSGYYGRGYYGPGYYGSGYGPRHRYDRPRYRHTPRYRPRRTSRLSCRAAKRVVRNYGYRNVRATDCRGSRYTFKATKRGRWYQVRMNSRSGRLFGIRRL